MSIPLGYSPEFIGEKLEVPLPALSLDLAASVAPVRKSTDNILRYPNYSVVQSAERKLPIYSAANINGQNFKKVTRKSIKASWRKDRRIAYKYQLGNELYRAPKSDFDKGHMTKREDVQWGPTLGLASQAARKTFYYTNAAPQHRKVNQAIWRNIEDYILHDETVAQNLKINVFTGPVLKPDDPDFVTPVREEIIKLPTLFWKVIYYTKPCGNLYRVAFMAGQAKVLEKEGIVRPQPVARGFDDLFMNFEEADTYQVSVPLIEELTEISFSSAIDLLWDQRPVKMIIEQVNVRGVEGSYVRIPNLIL